VIVLQSTLTTKGNITAAVSRSNVAVN